MPSDPLRKVELSRGGAKDIRIWCAAWMERAIRAIVSAKIICDHQKSMGWDIGWVIYNFKKLKQLIFSNNIIEIEYLLFLSIALPIFPYQYSNGIQIYVAYLLIMSNLNLFIPNINFNKLSYTSND